MKNYSLILLISLLLICACKIRQVSTTKADQIIQSAKTDVQENNMIHVDTTQKVAHILSQKLQQSSIAIEITPDTGIIHIVNDNYIGKARSIVIKGNSASLQNTDQIIQQNKAEITQSVLKDSSEQQSSEQMHTKTKQTYTTYVSCWLYLITGMLALGILVLAKIKHWL